MAEGKWLMAESTICHLPSAICHDSEYPQNPGVSENPQIQPRPGLSNGRA